MTFEQTEIDWYHREPFDTSEIVGGIPAISRESHSLHSLIGRPETVDNEHTVAFGVDVEFYWSARVGQWS